MTIDKQIVLSPQKWAYKISHILNSVLGEDHFPIKVKEVAKEISKQIYPQEPITLVKGSDLEGFEGALYQAPKGKKGWGIIYNSAIRSKGRINFTLAHEFGHYLLHRHDFPNGLECSENDLYKWNSAYGKIENQANTFASNLLMPLDDFRKRINENEIATIDDLSSCAERYDVSFIASTLRWLSFTLRSEVLVVSRDGFILWARSSQTAYKNSYYIKTSGLPPKEVPSNSIAKRAHLLGDNKESIRHSKGVWFEERCEETSFFSDQYDICISLISL
jgi:hypothetical protein